MFGAPGAVQITGSLLGLVDGSILWAPTQVTREVYKVYEVHRVLLIGT